MQVQQLSIFIEHQPGQLAKITEVLAAAGVNIMAISVTDTSDYGLIRCVCDRTDDAMAALKAGGIPYSRTNVLAVAVPDVPGSFSRAVRLLSKNGFDLEYMYCFVTRKNGKETVVIRVDDGENAAKALQAEGWEVFSHSDIANK